MSATSPDSDPGREPVHVLIADDHPVFRSGLRALLGVHTGFTVVGEAADGAAAVATALNLQPDVVIMDLHMPALDGIDATRKIAQHSPHIGVMVLTMSEDDASVFNAIRAGARGYLVKGSDHDEIINAIRSVASGHAVYGWAVAARIIEYFNTTPQPAPPTLPELTSREREVLDLIARSMTNQAIATRLHLAPKTVRNHVSNIVTKLQVADRAHAILRAREVGLGQ